MRLFKGIQLQHVPRIQNQEANALALEQMMEVTIGAIRLKLPLFQESDTMEDIFLLLDERRVSIRDEKELEAVASA